jgi:hypothetical protein
MYVVVFGVSLKRYPIQGFGYQQGKNLGFRLTVVTDQIPDEIIIKNLKFELDNVYIYSWIRMLPIGATESLKQMSGDILGFSRGEKHVV